MLYGGMCLRIHVHARVCQWACSCLCVQTLDEGYDEDDDDVKNDDGDNEPDDDDHDGDDGDHDCDDDDYDSENDDDADDADAANDHDHYHADREDGDENVDDTLPATPKDETFNFLEGIRLRLRLLTTNFFRPFAFVFVFHLLTLSFAASSFDSSFVSIKFSPLDFEGKTLAKSAPRFRRENFC